MLAKGSYQFPVASFRFGMNVKKLPTGNWKLATESFACEAHQTSIK